MYRVASVIGDKRPFQHLRIATIVLNGLFSALITPTLHFRFRKEELTASRFENDPDYGSMAYRTKEKVEAWRLGILGTVLTGINAGWWNRVRGNPKCFATGVVQLAGAALLLRYSYPSLRTTAFLAGCLLA